MFKQKQDHSVLIIRVFLVEVSDIPSTLDGSPGEAANHPVWGVENIKRVNMHMLVLKKS